MVDRWDQHRVSRDRKSWQALKVLLVGFAADLVWEVIRANLDPAQKADWPWRFTILDPSTCATLGALLAGLLVTRSQYAQTMLPLLSWTAYPGTSDHVQESRRTVRLFNAGGGRAMVREIAYRFQLKQLDKDLPSPTLSPWLSWPDLVSEIDAAGLQRPQDIYILHLGPGASVPLTSRSSEGIELVAFGEKAFGQLLLFDVRIQIVDTLGDVHEKKLRCLRTLLLDGAALESTAP